MKHDILRDWGHSSAQGRERKDRRREERGGGGREGEGGRGGVMKHMSGTNSSSSGVLSVFPGV